MLRLNRRFTPAEHSSEHMAVRYILQQFVDGEWQDIPMFCQLHGPTTQEEQGFRQYESNRALINQVLKKQQHLV